MERGQGRKSFSVKDIVIIVLCLVALLALFFILQKSKETEQIEQQQLNEIQTSIEQSGEITSENLNKKEDLSGIVINEVNQEGWIELYNTGNVQTNLGGMSLCINGEKVGEIPADASIEAESVYVFETGSILGTERNNVFTLKDKNDNQVSTMIVPQLLSRESYGHSESGSLQVAYLMPSKDEINVKDNVILKDTLTFSVLGGFYDGAISLEINVPKGTDVYYTLDGSDPTTESQKYENTIKIENRSGSNYSYAGIVNNGYKPSRISMGTVVRAIAVNTKGEVVEECTESYFIGIGNNSNLVNLPVISLTTDPDNLFDYFEGMYIQGKYYEEDLALGIGDTFNANYLMNWEKDAHIEFFEDNKDKSFAGKINLSMLRDYSMSTPQKGFLAKGIEEGAWKGSTLYRYFDDVSNRLKIQANKRDNDSKAREYLVNELIKNTAVGYVDMIPCSLFINGEYWGGYTLRAPMDELYFSRHYGITDEHVIIAKDEVVEEYGYRDSYTQLLEFVSMRDMSLDTNYEQLKTMMDIQSYLDYFCVNMFIANADYGIDETYAWKTVTIGENEYADGRWRWIVGKLDNSMNTSSARGMATSSINTYLLQEVREDVLLRSLIKNDEFKSQLQKTMSRLAEEVFTYEMVETKLEEITSVIEKMATSSYERFYGSPSSSFYEENKKMILKFYAERPEYILYYTENIDEIIEMWQEYTPEVQIKTLEEMEGITTNENQGTEQQEE